jgi:hypothetical protein
MLRGGLGYMLKSVSIKPATSVPAAISELAASAKVVESELTSSELALDKPAARERRSSKLAIAELDANKDGAIEQAPVPLTAIELTLQEQ